MVLAQAWCLASLLDAVIIQQSRLNEINYWLAGLALAWGARALIVGLRALIGAKASAHLRTSLRQELTTQALAAGPAFRMRHSSAGLAQSLLDRIDDLDPYYAKYQPQLITVIIVPVILAIAIAFTNWLAALVLVISAPFIPLFMALIGMGASKLSLEQQYALDRLGGMFYDRISGLPTLTRFKASRREREKLQHHNESFRQRTMRVLRVAFLSSAVLEFFSALAIAVMAIYIGFSLLGFIQVGPSDDMTLRAGLFMLLLAPEFYNPLRGLGQFWHDRANALAASAFLISIQNAPPARVEPDVHDGSLVNERPSGLSVTLDRVDIVAGTKRHLFRDTTSEFAARQCHLIAGASGAGKTTLLNHIAGFCDPQSGELFFNDVAVSTLTRNDLSELRAWLGQRPQLISGTIRDNLCLEGVHDDRTLEAALKLAGLGEWLTQCAEGLDWMIGPEGLGLSLGQVQRLCLARLLLTPKPLLLLDEPTTGLDHATERKLWSDLKDLSHNTGMTIIATSHSQLAYEWCDVCWHIKDQRLVQS